MRRAVVVGSNGAEGSSRLRYAQSDAKRFASVLSHPRCRFDVTVVKSDQAPQDVERSVALVADACDLEDTLVVYFSGHGFVERSSLLLELDKTNRERPLSALRADALVSTMKFARARHKVLILDCCYAGSVFSESQFRSSSGIAMKSVVAAEPSNEGESFVVIVASDRLEFAKELEAKEAGFLTTCICLALGDQMDEADIDGDGAIDLMDLRSWLDTSAKKHNKEYPGDKVPVPFVFGRDRGPLFFTIDPSNWQPYQVAGPNETSFVLLPLRASESEAWLIGRAPVTNKQFRVYVGAGGLREPRGEKYVAEAVSGLSRWQGPYHPWSDETHAEDDQPVVCVDYRGACDYASWLSERTWKKLQRNSVFVSPTEVWDFAAFGRLRPPFDPKIWLQSSCDRRDAPAGADGADAKRNRFGVINLFGCVWQWTSFRQRSWEGPEFGSFVTLGRQPSFPDWELRNLQLRGGSFLDDMSKIDPLLVSGTLADQARTRHSDLGFRLATTVDLKFLPSELRSPLRSAPICAKSANDRDRFARVPPAA